MCRGRLRVARTQKGREAPCPPASNAPSRRPTPTIPSTPTRWRSAAAPGAGDGSLRVPGQDPGLSLLGDRPAAAETPERLLDDETTPIAQFFIRNNGNAPDAPADPDAWRIALDGEVNTPLALSLGALKSHFQAQTMRMALECDGDGRAASNPPARGDQWTNGGADADPANFRVMESAPVRGILTSPANGATFAAGTDRIALRGAAWAGDHEVARVDVSIDFGAPCLPMTLAQTRNRCDWVRWTGEVRLPSDGHCERWTRAADDRGVA